MKKRDQFRTEQRGDMKARIFRCHSGLNFHKRCAPCVILRSRLDSRLPISVHEVQFLAPFPPHFSFAPRHGYTPHSPPASELVSQPVGQPASQPVTWSAKVALSTPKTTLLNAKHFSCTSFLNNAGHIYLLSKYYVVSSQEFLLSKRECPEAGRRKPRVGRPTWPQR